MGKRSRHGRGFALVEVGAAVAVLGVACCLGAVAARQNRLGAGLSQSMGNLQRLAEVTANYGADYEDRFWTFSWKAGDDFSQYGDLNNAGSDLDAAANQAVDILRRRFDPDFGRITGWIPHIKSSSLVLADYLDEALPMEWLASPGDRYLLEWQRDPHGAGDTWSERRRAFWSSYAMPTAFVSPDESPTIVQSSAHNIYQSLTSVELGGRRLAEVAFPSGKVHLSEEASWFFGPRPAFYLHPEARVPMVMVDGSAQVRTTADANAGWDPDQDWSSQDDQFGYTPQEWEPPAFSDSGHDRVFGKYRWTRHGLAGVDFDGERVE